MIFFHISHTAFSIFTMMSSTRRCGLKRFCLQVAFLFWFVRFWLRRSVRSSLLLVVVLRCLSQLGLWVYLSVRVSVLASMLVAAGMSGNHDPNVLPGPKTPYLGLQQVRGGS